MAATVESHQLLPIADPSRPTPMTMLEEADAPEQQLNQLTAPAGSLAPRRVSVPSGEAAAGKSSPTSRSGAAAPSVSAGLARHGSAKATIGSRLQPPLLHQHLHRPPRSSRQQQQQQQQQLTNSLTVGGQPRGGRPLAHSAIIAAAAAAAVAAASSSSSAAAAVANSATAAGPSSASGAAFGSAGKPAGHRHFSVKRVDEVPLSGPTAVETGGETQFSAAAGVTDNSSALDNGNYSSKSEFLESRRRQQQQQQQQQMLQSKSNAACRLDEGEDCCYEGDNSPVSGYPDNDDENFCDDLCPLCDTCVKNSRGRTSGIQLDDNPGVIRWQKLPCRCKDRYLHVSCLETGFYEDSVYKGGRRRLIISCQVCQTQLLIRRNRSRRACDHQACLSFARHLLSVLLIAGFLIAFGAWSLLHPLDGRPTVVNVGLVSLGCLALLLFFCYEIWLLHGRFDFVISRLSEKAASKRVKSSDNRGNINNNNNCTKGSAGNLNNASSASDDVTTVYVQP